MARELEIVPPRWKSEGIWYVPDFPTGNRAAWKKRTAELGCPRDAARDADRVVAGRIRPLSGGEVSSLVSAQLMDKASIGMVGGKPHVSLDGVVGDLSDGTARGLCSRGLIELSGYVKVTCHPEDFDEDGSPIDGYRKIKEPVKNGAELVEFVDLVFDAGGEHEFGLISDFAEAIRNRTHLEKGLAKKLPLSPAGPQAGTPASDGGAGTAKARRSRSIRKARQSKTSESPETVKT